ncbi:hypothetical protein H6F67_18460 [Microcoleus sp. FACHB-1515]|uniref:hypothetical protein n=1 Tax=Cyanophyceae TaxID=3028117 RepID=UPI00168858D0|nr:hypothetical protein [Microcoleus sp. FACHB-1515]MBD2091829.1 hypothetical protein [Microcoleus sp. FACHB-1515]
MKVTSSSKAVRTIVLAALVAVVGYVGLQKPANAQLQTQSEPAQSACAIASEQAPNGVFDGVNLSARQFAAYDAVINRYNTQVVPRLDARAERVIKPDAMVVFIPQRGVEVPSEVQNAISTEVIIATPAQIDALTARYSQYGSFFPEQTLVYSQALFEEFERESQALQNQILAVMTPEQQQRYRQNQTAFQRSNEACGLSNSPFTRVGNSYEMGGLF